MNNLLFSLGFFYFFILRVSSFKLCIVGAGSGLGRELVSQSITDYNCTVLGLTANKKTIDYPYRGNGFNDIGHMNKIEHPNLVIDSYWNNVSDDYQHLILCTGAGPFEKDYSDILTSKILEFLPSSCQSINLVSAWGTGDSLTKSNWGIQVMDSWYLQDVYRAKNEQEKMIQDFHNKIQTRIYRPKALSYGNSFLESTTRYDLASEILENIFFIDDI